jgi:hypothetical protein
MLFCGLQKVQEILNEMYNTEGTEPEFLFVISLFKLFFSLQAALLLLSPFIYVLQLYDPTNEFVMIYLKFR